MLAERLGVLRPTDPAPAWAELVEAIVDVETEIAQLPAELLSVFSETLVDSWEEIATDQREMAVRTAVGRLVEVEDPMMFASALDRLTRSRRRGRCKRRRTPPTGLCGTCAGACGTRE